MRVKPLILVAVAASLAAAGCDGTVVSTAGDSTPNDVNSYEVERRVDRLVVRADAGSVRVRGTDADKPPAVTEELHHDGQKPRTTHEIDAGALVLTATCPSGGRNRCWVDYTITVQRAVEVAVETGAGDVDVDNATASVEASTGAGDVRADGLAASPVTARSDAGGLMLEFTAAPETVDATTSAGDVTVRLPDGASYAVDAGTEVGERTVDVRTASDSRRQVRARTDVGDVAVVPAA